MVFEYFADIVQSLQRSLNKKLTCAPLLCVACNYFFCLRSYKEALIELETAYFSNPESQLCLKMTVYGLFLKVLALHLLCEL